MQVHSSLKMIMQVDRVIKKVMTRLALLDTNVRKSHINCIKLSLGHIWSNVCSSSHNTGEGCGSFGGGA